MGNDKIIHYLNEALGYELTRINQSFLHAKIYQDWGLNDLGDHEHRESLDETGHANSIIERIFSLGGMPNMQVVKPLRFGETAAEIIDAVIDLETGVEPMLREAVQYCVELGDYVSEVLLQGMLDREGNHVHWLESQKMQLATDYEDSGLVAA